MTRARHKSEGLHIGLKISNVIQLFISVPIKYDTRDFVGTSLLHIKAIKFLSISHSKKKSLNF